MFTRKEYMDKEISHKDYYAQFVTYNLQKYVVNSFTSKKLSILRKEYDSGNVHLSCIDAVPLKLWDNLQFSVYNLVPRSVTDSCGEVRSLSTAVCIAKAAMTKYFDSLED